MLHVVNFHFPQLQNKVCTPGDKTALPKVEIPPILENPLTSHFVNFTPQPKNFNKTAFPEWRDRIGNKYLALNPLTKNGQEEIARMNEINLSDDFWDRDLHETCWDLLVEVHRKGPLDGWNAGTREGLHRRTGLFIRLLCVKFDSATLRVNTLTENDFIHMGIGKLKSDQTDDEFRAAIRKKLFMVKKRRNLYSSRTVRTFTSRSQILTLPKRLGIIELSVKI